MGTPGPTPSIKLSDVLRVFEERENPREPLTASEVATELGTTRRTAHKKLDTLSERGDLESKRPGARSRVWWLAPEVDVVDTAGGRSLKEEQFEAFADQVHEYAIFVLDDEGYIETWNEGAENIKGYSKSEIIGEHLSTFYTPEARARDNPSRNLRAAIEMGEIEDEGWRVRKDGSRFWANITLTALRDDSGTLRGFAKVTRDMTERRQYERQLEQQRDELDELDRLNAVIRDIDQALVTAETRDAVEDAVCDRLAAFDIYAAAWIGDRDPGGTLGVTASAGVDPSRTDSSFEGTDTDTIEFDLASRALETGTHQIAVHDPDGDGFDHWHTDVFQVRPETVVALPLLSEDHTFGVLVLYATEQHEFDDRKLDVLTELADTITNSLAAIRRKEREERLTALHRATRDLVHTEGHEELGDVVTTTVVDTLGLNDAHVYHFQTGDNTLNPITSATRDRDDVVKLPVLTASSDSVVWDTFVGGTPRRLDPDTADGLSVLGDVHRQELIVPLGDHGVLVVGGDRDESIDTDDQHLVELVAATAEAAFDRLESEANLRERDSILQDQNQRLQRLNQVNTVIREVDQGLVTAKTYEGIQRVVCERLTSTDRFRFAWVGEISDAEGTLTPAVSAGAGQAYLDAISLDGTVDEPAVVAARTGLVQVVENVADDLRAAPWRSEAFSRELQSCIAVPLAFGDVTYGVLAVYGDRPGTFGEIEESVFDELGTTIGNALHAVETKQAILSDNSVEVEFSITDPTDTIVSRFAAEANTTISHEGTIPTSDGEIRVFVSTDTGGGAGSDGSTEAHASAAGDEPEVSDTTTLLDAADGMPGVSGSSVVTTSAERDRFEFEVTEDALIGDLGRRNVSVLEFEATPTDATLTVDVPASEDVGGFIDWFVASYPSATFVSRHERENGAADTNPVRSDLAETMTTRQFEVLKTAYLSGFFDAPRQSSGREIAALLDVSQPTVTEHLRAAQRRVLERVFDE